jgi:hypothetical protein
MLNPEIVQLLLDYFYTDISEAGTENTSLNNNPDRLVSFRASEALDFCEKANKNVNELIGALEKYDKMRQELESMKIDSAGGMDLIGFNGYSCPSNLLADAGLETVDFQYFTNKFPLIALNGNVVNATIDLYNRGFFNFMASMPQTAAANMLQSHFVTTSLFVSNQFYPTFTQIMSIMGGIQSQFQSGANMVRKIIAKGGDNSGDDLDNARNSFGTVSQGQTNLSTMLRTSSVFNASAFLPSGFPYATDQGKPSPPPVSPDVTEGDEGDKTEPDRIGFPFPYGEDKQPLDRSKKGGYAQ